MAFFYCFITSHIKTYGDVMRNRTEVLLDKSQANITFNSCPAEPGYTLPLQRVDPDQLASEEANWFGSARFVIQYGIFYP